MKRKFILLLCCLLLSGCKEKVSDKIPSNLDISLNNTTLEVHSIVYLNELIDSSNMTILSDNALIDTTKIGTFEYEIKYELDNKKYLYKIDINIVDTVSPKIYGASSRTILKGYQYGVCNLVLIGDNYDKEPNCDIEGEYNLNKVGTYNLKLNVSDKSGNEVIHNMVVNVVEKFNNVVTGTQSNILFEDVYAKYKTDKTELGIDVSEWQGEVDFNKVKEAGATFVFMRIGVQGAVEGEIKEDKYFEQNLKNAKKAGLKVGVYLYSTATTVEKAKEHANWVINRLNGEKLDLQVVFDWENWAYWNFYKISFYDINVVADTFINAINNAGYEGMLYGSASYLKNIWENRNDFPIWLAHYTTKTNYEGKYSIWQFTDKGRIDGIEGDVDFNVLYR